MPPPDPALALQQHFGLSRFRDGQEAVIGALMAGRSALAVFPTGGGKSLCYQLPALLLDGLTLVVSPLIALMKDQVDALQARGLAAARLDSSLTGDETREIYHRMQKGALKLLYVAPERLANERFLESLNHVGLSMMAVDEAHCISEWGHNFRPDYLKLARLVKSLEIPQVLALTATATPAVAEDICRAFAIAKSDHTQLSFHRANLHLEVTPCTAGERQALLLEKIQRDPTAATIVYVTLQHTAERVATFLQKAGVPARAYHAGLPNEVRVDCQDAFMSGNTTVIVATIAFGMGIDKADIRRVYHYNLPKSLENYSQEIGRAGRDALPAVCEMLACADDLTTLENFAYGDTPTPQALRHLVDHLLRQGDTFDVSFYELSSVNDIRPLVIATLMTYLELEGVIAATRPFYHEYKVRFVRGLEHLLKGYDPERQAFLRKVFQAGKSGRAWTSLIPSEIADSIKEPRERIVAAIGHLEEAGDLMVKPTGVRQGYRVLKAPPSPRALADRLQTLFEKREAMDIGRLRNVVALAEKAPCLTQALLAYFGEIGNEACGHCSRCDGQHSPVVLPRSSERTLTSGELEAIDALARERLAPLRTPRQLTRFLCGLTSPAASRARLSRRDEFGLLEDVPFKEVLAHVQSLAHKL